MGILVADKTQYAVEQDQLLETILNNRFFYPWINYEALQGDQALRNDANIEFYITADCNQKCEYCYLHKYPQLYPRDKMDPDTILHNLKLVYEWMIEHEYHVPRLDMFTGEIWGSKLGWDIFDLTLEYTHKGLLYDDILIASNCSFVAHEKTFQKIQQYINEFSATGHPLLFSISIDGKLLDNDGRPRNDPNFLYTDEFYDKLFAFAKYNNYLFHPMISPHNIAKWHDNLNWWREMFDIYEMDLHQIMFLEVRDREWNDESIKQYCDFVIELAEDYLKNKCHNNIQIMGNTLGNIRLDNNTPILNGYYPWVLSANTDSFIGCTIANHLSIRLGDLALCPCHRTAYDKYLYGFFKVEDDKIVGITARNPQMAIKIFMSSHHTAHNKCNMCLWNHTCLKGCLGSQIETMQDPFIPIPSVCKLFDAKHSAIIKWYEEKGIIKYWESIGIQEPKSEYVIKLLHLIYQWRQRNEMEKC